MDPKRISNLTTLIIEHIDSEITGYNEYEFLAAFTNIKKRMEYQLGCEFVGHKFVPTNKAYCSLEAFALVNSMFDQIKSLESQLKLADELALEIDMVGAGAIDAAFEGLTNISEVWQKYQTMRKASGGKDGE